MAIYSLPKLLRSSIAYDSHALLFPDGMERIITLSKLQWQLIEEMRGTFPLEDMLESSLKVARMHPTGAGFEMDVLWAVVDIVRIYSEGEFRQRRSDHANDNNHPGLSSLSQPEN